MIGAPEDTLLALQHIAGEARKGEEKVAGLHAGA